MLRKYMMVLFGMGLLILSIITSGCMQSDDTANIGMAVEFNDHAACAYIANDKGWYDEEGINLTTYESYATGMRLISAIGRGDIQVAYICLAPALVAYSRGVPVTIIAGTHKHGYGLVAGSEITDISDLNGATIGCVREGSMVMGCRDIINRSFHPIFSLLRVDTIIVCLMVLSVMCLIFERSFGYIETRMTEQWR